MTNLKTIAKNPSAIRRVSEKMSNDKALPNFFCSLLELEQNTNFRSAYHSMYVLMTLVFIKRVPHGNSSIQTDVPA